MKKILITGALGHIGSRVLRELDVPGVTEIVLLDNLDTQRYASLFDLPTKYKYTFLQEDIRTNDPEKMLEGIDAVIHLAAKTDAESSHGKAEEVEAVNLDGLKRVADACFKKNVRLLFPSTTSVYGSQEDKVDETCEELKPQSPYAESKLAAEKYLQELGTKGLKFVICRFGTIFGYSVGMRFHTAVNKFTWQALLGQPVTVWKTAWKQRRPYLDLNDCVAAINFVLEKDLFDGQIYNVLTKNFTVEEIVTAIQEFAPKLEVNYVDSAIMNQLSYDVDDAKFRGKGFHLSGNLRKALEETFKKLSGIQTN